MPNLTQLITRQSGLEFWYPLDNDTPLALDPIIDESGNNRDLDVLGIDKALVTANQLNGYAAVVHNGETDIRKYTGSLSIRDLFTVAKVDDTPDFVDPYRGFITGLTATTNNALLIGVGSTTRFLSVAEGAANMGYLYDDALTADNNRIAPFTGFHRLRLSTSGAAITLDGLQVGQDRADTARLFAGKWADIMGFSTQRTVEEARAIALYYDLKFGLHLTNNTSLYFPTPGMTGVAYRHFYAAPRKWDDVTLSHEYDDRGRSFNLVTDTPPREWDVVFDVVDATHTAAKLSYDIFDAFWDAVGIHRSFSFTDKYGTTWENVNIKDYSRRHSEHRSWKNEVAFRLCQYP